MPAKTQRLTINSEKQDRARRAALSSLKDKGKNIMAKRRVGLTFEDWQIEILDQLAKHEGIEQVATFIKRDMLRIYPTLKQRPKVGAVGGAGAGAAGGAGPRAAGGSA